MGAPPLAYPGTIATGAQKLTGANKVTVKA